MKNDKDSVPKNPPMHIREIEAKHILTRSKLNAGGYTINPYVGCQHACVYCYACFMKRLTNHDEPWGEFVDDHRRCGGREVFGKALKSLFLFCWLKRLYFMDLERICP